MKNSQEDLYWFRPKLIKSRMSKDDIRRLYAQDLFIQYLFDEELFDRKLHLNKRVKELAREFPDIAKTPEIIDIYKAKEQNIPWRQMRQIIPPERARVYCDKLLEGFPEYLKPDRKEVWWFTKKLHQKVSAQITGVTSPGGGFIQPIDRITIDIFTFPYTRKTVARNEVIEEFEKQWKRTETHKKYVKRIKKAENIEDDVKWELIHMLYGRQYLLGYIPEYINTDVIDSRLKKIRQLLRIGLPPHRPHKAKKGVLKPIV